MPQPKKPVSISDDNPYESPLVTMMRADGIPMTREEYLKLNYLGSVPEKISPEEEAEFPLEFQLGTDDDEEEVVDASEFED